MIDTQVCETVKTNEIDALFQARQSRSTMEHIELSASETVQTLREEMDRMQSMYAAIKAECKLLQESAKLSEAKWKEEIEKQKDIRKNNVGPLNRETILNGVESYNEDAKSAKII